MDEQKLQVVNHPLFGEIQVSQSENGNTLYRAATVAERIGISDYKSYVGKSTKMPIKFIDEDGTRSMLVIVCEHKIHRAMKNYKTQLTKL